MATEGPYRQDASGGVGPARARVGRRVASRSVLPRGLHALCGGRRRRPSLAAALLLALLAPAPVFAGPAEHPAREYLESISPSERLQAILDRELAELTAGDAELRTARMRVALIDLDGPGAPALAHHNGDLCGYPASVVKLVYLMAAYHWQEEGRLRIDPELERLLRAMVHDSSNRATQQVLVRLTGARPGPDLPEPAYREFVEQRLAVKRWLGELGVEGLHCVHPTYDGEGDISGRELQFLRDGRVPGGLSTPGGFANRQSMTALGTARLLALLAAGRALGPEATRRVREQLRRDPADQPYQARRIAGGALRHPGVRAESKSGTWGPIFADAGIVTHQSGRQLVLVVFLERDSGYHGPFIAELADRLTAALLLPEGSGRQ